MTQPIIVHINDVMQYKSCRRKWDLSSRYRGNLQPKQLFSPFFIGTGFHYCLEELRSDGVSPVSALAKYLRQELKDRKKTPAWLTQRPAVRQDVILTRAMLEQYVQWRRSNRGPFADTNLDTLAHEMAFGEGAAFPSVPLMANGKILQPEVHLAGRLDGVDRVRTTNEVWLSEYKTCRSIEERAKLLQHDEQATAYCYAASHLLEQPIEGVLYTLVRKKRAMWPEKLKRGGLSKNKVIDTSVEIYREAILREHGDRSERWIQENYGDILNYIKDFKEPFVARVGIRRSRVQLDLFAAELHSVAVEMHNPRTPLYPNRTYSCPGCQFRQVCLAMDRGESDRIELLLRAEYELRTLPEVDEL